MTRLRITLILLALGVGLPAMALVVRAVESLELENAYRHEAVAERVFDEMERSLSDFLLREERRPPSDYDRGMTSESAQFLATDEPFVIGWFRLDAVGGTQLLARRPFDSARIEAALASTLGSYDASAGSRSDRAPGLEGIDKDAPAPGRTKSTGLARLAKKTPATPDDDTFGESSAYDVLQNLNRAQSLRLEQQSKSRRRSSPQLGGLASPSASAPAESEMDSRLLDEAQEGAPAYTAEAEQRESADSLEEKMESSLRERELSNVASVDPLIGRLTETGDLVLTRSVWREGRVDREGLVLDRAALVGWLRETVLGKTGLSDRARVDFATPNLPARSPTEHRYLHRFAEPFDGLVARLDLAPLTGLTSARPIYALALLLGVVGTIGLFAVDRMTRVVVEYAQRRSDFVAAVSHELKTPLTAIRMYGEMLRDGLVSSETKRAEYYETITDESERLSRLIDNVLEFSRLEQDRRKLDLVVGGLAETVREAAEKLRAHVEHGGFALRLELAETLPRIRYDRDAVTQILFNLVDNAIKYARDAERREILIRLAAIGEHVELSVRDFGPGVASDQLERIFEPFYRVGDELTRTTDGTGIGLALVRELVKKTGGRVRGSNEADGGFAVVIDLGGVDTPSLSSETSSAPIEKT